MNVNNKTSDKVRNTHALKLALQNPSKKITGEGVLPGFCLKFHSMYHHWCRKTCTFFRTFRPFFSLKSLETFQKSAEEEKMSFFWDLKTSEPIVKHSAVKKISPPMAGFPLF